MTTLKEEIARLKALEQIRKTGDERGEDELYTSRSTLDFLQSAPDMMLVIEQQARMLEVAREALGAIAEFRHVDDCGSDSGGWQSEELESAFTKVATAIAAISEDQELDPGPIETTIRLDEDTEIRV
jgi:hypothetical protein